MADLKQEGRCLAIKTPLGPDELVIESFTMTESISSLFTLNAQLLSANPKIKAKDLIGQSVTVSVRPADKKEPVQFFNGIVRRFAQGPAYKEESKRFRWYAMEVVPKIWLQTQRINSRIFQPPESSVPQILKKILQGFDPTDEIQGKFYPRHYCVQYRESDFHFASRLMEEEGIFYYFKHADGEHKLVLANTPQTHKSAAGFDEFTYVPSTGEESHGGGIEDWRYSRELRSGKVTLWDYNMQVPDKHLDASKDSMVQWAANSQLEVYDYPGEYAKRFSEPDKPEDIQKLFEENARTAGLRMQELDAGINEVWGESTRHGLSSGHKFKLKDRSGQRAGEHVITGVSHWAAQSPSYVSGEPVGTPYRCTFTCIPHGSDADGEAAPPFRPARKTPKPIVHGTQTAVVVGPGGEEIYTDKYGRVKVQFHWDREGKKDAKSSCWVRVGSPLAGKNWGMIHIPRMGQEVIVDFLEGDPDRPIIIGSVYNEDQMPPYALPANKTQTGIVSRSSLEGNPDTFNEICFEDKKGEELLYIRAEKDQTIAVENDEAHWVGHDREKTIDNDETTLIHHDRTETVDNNEKITIGVDRTEEVGRDEEITIGRDRTEEVGRDESITIGNNREETVGKDETISIGSNRTESVGKDETISVGGSQTEEVSKDRSVTIGSNDTLGVAKKLTITAGDSITLTTGAASIVMRKDGTIIISGKDITVDGSGAINVKASKNVVMKGQKILQN
jgi:type VI secretion system secreted protein VgrG